MWKWIRKVPPEVGSVWYLRGEENNPFTNEYEITIESIKKGWVQYFYTKYPKYFSQRPIRMFRMIFKEIK